MEMKVDAKRIRDARTNRAWSQEHLAEVSGLGLRTIQRIEAGGNASLESVAALSTVLAIPIVELVQQQHGQRGLIGLLADNRLLAMPLLVFIALAVFPPHLAWLATVAAFWLILEIYVAVVRRSRLSS